MKKDHPGTHPEPLGSNSPRANLADRRPEAAFAESEMRMMMIPRRVQTAEAICEPTPLGQKEGYGIESLYINGR